jgi:hypothetical protein
MARYYDIQIFTTQSLGTPNPKPFRHWTTLPNGVNDPGALQVEFDFFSYLDAGSGTDGSTITIHGVPLTDITQAQQFAGATPGSGMQIIVKGGMSAGLPLNDPKQSGLILSGQIFQSFGNWVGTEMNLNFVVYGSLSTIKSPGNFVMNWKAGTTLADALTQCIKVAYRTSYPNLSVTSRIARYVNTHDRMHVVSTLSQLGKWASKTTQAPVFVSTPINGGIIISDGSTAGKLKQIAFNDLIGQPTWNAVNTMQLTTVMRADIQIGDFIKMPQGSQGAPGFVQTAAASTPTGLKYKTAFQGDFIVRSVRQVGNFRDVQGSSWATVFECSPQSSISAG